MQRRQYVNTSSRCDVTQGNDLAGKTFLTSDIQTFIIQDRNEIPGKFLQNTIYDHIFYQIWLEII